MKRIAVLAAIVLLLTGCKSDPFGIAQATQIDANAQVAIAQANAQVATNNAAYNYALATQSQALLREARSDAVIVLLALALVVVVALVVAFLIMQRRERHLPEPVYIAPLQPRYLPPPTDAGEEIFIKALLEQSPRR